MHSYDDDRERSIDLGVSTPATASKPPIKNAGSGLYLRFRPTLLRISNRFCSNRASNSATTSNTTNTTSKRRSPLFYLFLLAFLTSSLMVIVIFERATKSPVNVKIIQAEDVGDDAWYVRQKEIKQEKIDAAARLAQQRAEQRANDNKQVRI